MSEYRYNAATHNFDEPAAAGDTVARKAAEQARSTPVKTKVSKRNLSPEQRQQDITARERLRHEFEISQRVAAVRNGEVIVQDGNSFKSKDIAELAACGQRLATAEDKDAFTTYMEDAYGHLREVRLVNIQPSGKTVEAAPRARLTMVPRVA